MDSTSVQTITSGPPRLTLYLRHYSKLSSNPKASNGYNFSEVLSLKREEKRKQMRDHGASWNNVKQLIESLGRNCGVNLNCYIKEIAETARMVAPEADTRDEIALCLFKLCYQHKVLPVAVRNQILHVVGEVKNSLIDRVHKASFHITEILGTDEVNKILCDLRNTSSTMKFGKNIKVGPVNEIPNLPHHNNLLYLVKKKTSTSNSLKFEEYQSTHVKDSNKREASERSELFDQSWLEAKMLKYYSDIDMIPELAKGTMVLLCGSKSDLELQNELFEFLGFDRFELIQSVLSKRADLQASSKALNQQIAVEKQLALRSQEPSFASHVTIVSESEKNYLKMARKEEKKLVKSMNKTANNTNGAQAFDPEILKVKRETALRDAQIIGLNKHIARTTAAPKFPYVFDMANQVKQMHGFVAGSKMMLPIDAVRTSDDKFEEVSIPAAPSPSNIVGEKLIPISELDELGQLAFSHCKTLNRIQTVVYPMAYHSNENLLICAPTGAGKTNIAMLTVIHQVRQYMEAGIIMKDKFKIVYIAPMKALAAEMARNFSQRLEPLNLVVKELTGDMHLTKPEIMATNMIITTPEKWDVTTRKPGDTQLAQLVKLLIIDEVHLLHGDRGPVLESLVARTLRMVESQQSMIRIVGLSATLPNYVDIASFLHVNPYKGLFYFDSRFRPVPLALSFVGVKAMGRIQQMEQMDIITYQKCHRFVNAGHQVMVFVHARNGTLRTANNLIKLAQDAGQSQDFLAENVADLGRAKKELSRSRNKKLVELFDHGFGVHHAGLLRQDRNMIERLFREGFIKVLVTTATLAWGVNLPAHAVIIKGTDIYDSRHGTFVDLGILDVLQIFGRAGRPQYDHSGHGTIVTTQEKLSHYLSLLTNQYPIESSFVQHLADNLNAEVALGTVTNITEAVEWLSYTYLYVRLRKNPQAYGLRYADAQNDPHLEMQRREYIVSAAKALDKANMIRYEPSTEYLHITDLGRIASQFYIKYDSVEIFNGILKEVMNEAEILALTSQASEFTQLKIRDEEMSELDELHAKCEVAAMGGVANIHGKVNILLQAYISREYVDGFSLISDMSYISENSVRISRALFEIILHKGWPLLANRFLTIAKMLERRLWNFESPLRQFPILPYEIMKKVEGLRLTVEQIRDMDAREIGQLIRHEKMGKTVVQCAQQFPLLELSATIQPITRTVLRVRLDVIADFRWHDKVHGKQEIYWIWVEDPMHNHMYHREEFKLNKKQVTRQEPQQLVFTIPIFEPLPSQYYVRAVSDKWLGCETTCAINFHNLILPDLYPPHTPLLDLDPLPVTALNNSKFEMLYRFSHFNPIQTQIFHCLYHTNTNVLLGAPTGSGKTIAAEIAIFKVFRDQPNTKVVYIAPLKALVRERVEDWKVRFGENLNKSVVELTGDVTPDIRAIQNSHVIITTPEKWDGISRSWQTRNYVQQVSLIIIDEIHLLGEDRGPVLEVIVSRTNFISSHTSRQLRIVGLSTALANAVDLANWLGIGQMGLYNFRPSVRPVPLEVHISGFPGKHYCPRMATMNKPTFQAIKQHSPDKPVLVFVSSRRQTRLTALDLMSFVVTEANPKQWLRMPEHEMEQILENVKEDNLRLCLSFGIGLHHAGLTEKDRKVVEELFVHQKILILIATSTLAWGVNFPAHLVVVKGTEYFDGKTKRYVDFPITDVLQMMGRAGRPQFDDHGVAVILVQDQKKHFYKKFLYEPFPVESSLLNVLADHLNAEIVAGTVSTKQEALDYLTWTYFFRRLSQNPTYYGLEVDEENQCSNDTNTFLSKIVENAISTLHDSSCVIIHDDDRTLEATPLGRIASFYYLSHETMQIFEEKLHGNVSLDELLRLLTDVHEYAELPVRHNEDNMNAELATKCPIQSDTHSFDSSHTKAHLLLQAHMSRLPLPCVDYFTDLKSVLDQALRILQAMIDVCSYAGWLAASLQVQVLMQMITQARWHSDSSLLCLPHVTDSCLHGFNISGKGITSLPQLIDVVGNKYELFAKMLRSELGEQEIESAYKVLRQYPIVNLNASLNGRWEDDVTNVPVDFSGGSCCVHANEEYSLVVHLKKLHVNSSTKAYAPKFPKPKDESWFLVLGERNSGELLALKRVPPIRQRTTHALTFTTPPNQGKVTLTLYFMSDSYLGFDQQYNIIFDILPPLPSPEEEVEVTEDSSTDKWIPPVTEPVMTPKSIENGPDEKTEEICSRKQSRKSKKNKHSGAPCDN